MASIHTPVEGRILAIRRRSIRSVAMLFCAVAACSPAVAAQPPPWRTLSNENGIHLEARRIPGERFDELRVSTSVKVSPDAVADFLLGKYLDAKNKSIRRSFLQRSPEVAVWSDVLRAPVAADRCYSMRFERQALAGGAIRVKFASLEGAVPKPASDCIALRSRGGVADDADGRGDAVGVCLADRYRRQYAGIRGQGDVVVRGGLQRAQGGGRFGGPGVAAGAGRLSGAADRGDRKSVV